MSEDQYQNLLLHQLAMNKETWSTLQGHGVTPQSQLRLDFTYVAPNDKAASSLQVLLRDQTDYDVTSRRSGDEWIVSGRTQATAISPEILDEWVDWMITAGLEADCIFDGWGTEV
jgi:hypothetical protein